MTVSISQSGTEARSHEVLTLDEAAAYLRVDEAELAALAVAGDVPARKIGGAWRFSKRALAEWLRGSYEPERRDRPATEELLAILERRLLERLKAVAPPKRGSKEAVLPYIGVFRDDDDLEEQLAILKAIQAANHG